MKVNKKVQIETVDESLVEMLKESVTLTGVFVFLGLIFLILVSFMVYLRFSNWSPFASFYQSAAVAPVSFLDQYNQQKSLAPTSKTADIKVTEDNLSQMINLSGSNFPLKNPSLKITPDGVDINGKTSNFFWGVSVDVILVPKVGGGKMIFNVKEIKAAGVVAPPKISDPLNSQISPLFNDAFSGLNQLKVDDVHCMVGYLLLTVEK